MRYKIKTFTRGLKNLLNTPVFVFKRPEQFRNQTAIILAPVEISKLNCGLAGIITFTQPHNITETPGDIISQISEIFNFIKKYKFSDIEKEKNISEKYLGGEKNCKKMLELARKLKQEKLFNELCRDKGSINKTLELIKHIKALCTSESKYIDLKLGMLSSGEGIKSINLLETLKDASWTLEKEVLENIKKIEVLSKNRQNFISVPFYRKINTVLNSINILEVRGRDSAGISVFVTFTEENYAIFLEALRENSLEENFISRKNIAYLTNYKISVRKNSLPGFRTIAFTYKFASETGSLGDNINFIRNQIKNDLVLQTASEIPYTNVTTGAHTRWASVGEISPLNCHPVDNTTKNKTKYSSNLIHVSLNGDIDNYQNLKSDFEDKVDKIQDEITTDTKIIPLQISRYYYKGNSIEESFRLAVNDFEGSHAILMQTDLAPGKIFLAQKGSGQAIFIGISEDSYTIASEVYGFVERTQEYYKLEGEKYNGQIVILDENTDNKFSGISSMAYDGTIIETGEDLIQKTPITSRDVDRQNFEHFFLKEISEAPSSVKKTLQGRWAFTNIEKEIKKVIFDKNIFPDSIKESFLKNKIKRIFFIGQGTAGIAANAGSYLVSYYMNKPDIQVSALKASELSGFILEEQNKDSMSDSLVVAITQSGTTTDTNKSIDMAKNCGAKTMAIVNRRDSDITFKVEGVLYTSTGRDIEMSVASTKAFYSQVTAASLLGLYLADLCGTRDEIYISNEIENLSELPVLMEKIFERKEEIKNAAFKTAPEKTYWATVGSGPNKSAADEIRIKLSELCYRTISTDFVEDKKHIDLSSEPLILICAAGARESVLSDIIKDTAIFKAHKSTTVVFADENESRFDLDADALIKIPETSEHLSLILITLAGHLWGYYAAMAINEDSKFFYYHRKNIKEIIRALKSEKEELFEIVLEKDFKEIIARFYKDIRRKQIDKNFFSILPPNFISDLLLVLNYLYGRLNASDFEIDFKIKGTPINMISKLFDMLSQAMEFLSRPIDAIKHQAKTVTVGTTRLASKFEGIVFELIKENNIETNQITPKNLVVIKNSQDIIEKIRGFVLYKIENLNFLGEPTEYTTISVVKKYGNLEKIPSRAEKDPSLKGTKKIIVSEGNVFIGKGQKDGRSIMVIPLTSKEGAEKHQRIEYLLSIEIEFKKEIPLYLKVKALGGKLERIKNNVNENNINWDDSLLNLLSSKDLFGLSYEKIVGKIISAYNSKK
ncbi:MAG: glutamine--fructose-6-phosphate aminotransferase [Deltaproteobacteria bacterium]|nr:MAG: glutamine--fructose-6-phosphate aminotransferase [Deltaproteobacteria bacterium]